MPDPRPDESATPGLALEQPTRDLVRAALADRPWALLPRTLAVMARSGDVPAKRQASDIVAATAFERTGGYMAGSVAIIPVYGVIEHRSSFWSWLFGGVSVEGLRAAIREKLEDQQATAIVLDIDSPGGSVDGVTELAADMRSMRGGPKPVVAVANSLAASAAYWIGSQCDELVVSPSAEVGSVGVYAVHEDDSGLLANAGIAITLISAGDHKVDGNPYEPLSDDARAYMQSQVDAFYGMFVSDVAKGRGVTADKVLADYGQGRTLLAKPALAAGMVDRIETLQVAVNRLAPAARSRRGSSAELPPREPIALHPDAVPAAAAQLAQLQPAASAAWNAKMRGLLRS